MCGLTKTIHFELTIGNRMGADIPASSPPVNNFAVRFQLTDKNLETDIDSLGITVIDAAIAPATDLRYAIASGSNVSLAGSVEVTLPEVHCLRATWLCVKVDANFEDGELDNNYKCRDIELERSCKPGE